MAIPVGGVHPIEIYEGAGFREEFEVFEVDETTPIDFVDGTTAIAQLRTQEKTSGTLLADFTIEITDNSLIIKLSAEEAYFNMSEEKLKTAYYDIFVTEPGQEPVMFMEGEAKINPAVTAPPPGP